MFVMTPNWLKKQFKGKDKHRDTSLVLVVGNNGYDYNYYNRTSKWTNTRELNIHLAMNGPLQMTYDEFDEFIENITTAVRRARAELDQHEAGN